MEVAEDSDNELEEELEGRQSQARIVRVLQDSEPSWHALLRRTSCGRTASITKTSPAKCSFSRSHVQPVPGPQGLHLSAARPAGSSSSRIIRTDGQPRPTVNIPAKVLLPSAQRLLFRADSRRVGRVWPQTACSQLDPLRCRPEAGNACSFFRPPPVNLGVTVAHPKDALTKTEIAILDGVLDMMDDQSEIKNFMNAYGVQPGDTLPNM